MVNVHFYSAKTLLPDSLRFDSVLIFNSSGAYITEKTGSTDSSALQKVYPDPQSPNMLVVFMRKTVSDSLRLAYHPEPAFISDACGYYYRFTGLTAETGHTGIFKSVAVSQPVVDSTRSATHVKVYF